MNHRKDLKRVDLQIASANRHELSLSVFMAEMDHLKQLNDKYGSATDDGVLTAFSPLCQHVFCHTDMVGPMGA
jgi:diguanylate cyclase (GGDEF)-like protein